MFLHIILCDFSNNISIQNHKSIEVVIGDTVILIEIGGINDFLNYFATANMFA